MAAIKKGTRFKMIEGQGTLKNFASPVFTFQNSNLKTNQNIYEDLSRLSDDEQQIPGTPRKRARAQSPKLHTEIASKLPPLVIVGSTITMVKNLLKQLSILNVSLKLTMDGIKAFTNSTVDFHKVKEGLDNNNLKYFTHQLRDEQKSKFILKGLPEMDHDEIMSELMEKGLRPVNIKELNIKQRRNNDHRIYLVTLLKKDRKTLLDCAQIKSISQVIVKWENYKNTRNGPTQCRNCLKFGHGSNHCKLNAKCIRCSENHKSAECPHIIEMQASGSNSPATTPKIPKEKLKCANCGLNHAASFQKCIKRIEFMSRHKITKNKVPIPRGFTHAPQLENLNFPYLNNPHQSAWSNKERQYQQKYTEPQPESNNENTDKLLNSQELFNIFLDLTSKLASAKTKNEQIQVIMNAALKFACPLNG